jgi:hypothetical protein
MTSESVLLAGKKEEEEEEEPDRKARKLLHGVPILLLNCVAAVCGVICNPL